MPYCKVHNVRFYRPKPQAINCMSLQKFTKKLAVLRGESVIEIWNLKHVPFIERTIVGEVDVSTVESLIWCGDRLFSITLDGLLIEYDLLKLRQKRVVTITGEAGYCIDATSDCKYLAVGTEQGYINVFNVDEDDVLFEKFLDKQEGRILCLKYDASGQFIASGSLDTIRLWDVNTGHALHRMTTGRANTKEATIVWCIHILQDLTIISGDSRGKLTFWDGKLGSQIESFQSHKSEILALCMGDTEDSLYCAGVDTNIVNYTKVKATEKSHKWVKSIQRKVHEHDVKNLVLCDKKLYSSGVDGYLACSYYPPKTLIKYPPVLQNPCVTITKKARFILLRFSNHLEVWSLGTSTDNVDNNSIFELADVPVHLLTLQRLVKNNEGDEVQEGITCASMSDNGKWIAFSTCSVLRIFSFDYEPGEPPTLLPVEDLPESCSASIHMVFTSNSRNLILAPQNGGLQVYDLLEGIPILVQTISTQTVFRDAITLLEVSASGKHIVAGDPQSNIAIWSLNEASEWAQSCKLPTYSDSAPTSLSIHPNSNILVVMYADHKMVEFDISEQRYTRFSRSMNKMKTDTWPSKSYPVRNIIFDSKKDNIIILHDDSYIVVADQNKPVPRHNAKIPKIELNNMSDDSIQFSSAFHAIKKYKHLVHLGWLSDDELVAVEVSPLSILEQLPPCLKQAKFGTK